MAAPQARQIEMLDEWTYILMDLPGPSDRYESIYAMGLFESQLISYG